MKFYLNLFLTLALCHLTLAKTDLNMVCYYDSATAYNYGLGKFNTSNLESALQVCTHLIYGYVGINPETFELMRLNMEYDLENKNFATVAYFKKKFPYVKFLLSVGGDKDLEAPEKYVQLLEAGAEKYNVFADSARKLLLTYDFDGLDLAFQLPRNKPRKVHSGFGLWWKSFKKFFTGDFIVDEKADEHKEQFTNLVSSLKSSFAKKDLMLTLTVLPNVNSTWYFNVPALSSSLDFVTLAAFDFTTPERNPEEADYTAPIFPPPLEGNRLPHYNVEYQVNYWIDRFFPRNKINVGIASYGRAWKMTTDSKTEGLPIVAATNGAADPGSLTKLSGILNWAEICLKLPNSYNAGKLGADAPLRRVANPKNQYGIYAFRPADSTGKHGMWVSYEDPDTASLKAAYVIANGLAGVALFDITFDDYRGQCTGDKFPILRTIRDRLLS